MTPMSDPYADPYTDPDPTLYVADDGGPASVPLRVRSANFARLGPLVCVVAVLVSSLLPWVVVRLPGQSEPHTYSLLTGAGATFFFVLAATVILVGSCLWLARVRAGLVVAAVGAASLALVATLVVAVASFLGQFVPTLGLFGADLASGQLTAGAGASVCAISAVVLSCLTIADISASRGIQLFVRVEWIVLAPLALLAASEVSSRVPWLSVDVGGGLAAFDLHGDGLIGSFIVNAFTWFAIFAWLGYLLVRDRRLRMLALCLMLIVGFARLLYAVVPWLGLSLARSLLPDDVGAHASVEPEPALFLGLAVALGLVASAITGLVRPHLGDGSVAPPDASGGGRRSLGRASVVVGPVLLVAVAGAATLGGQEDGPVGRVGPVSSSVQPTDLVSAPPTNTRPTQPATSAPATSTPAGVTPLPSLASAPTQPPASRGGALDLLAFVVVEREHRGGYNRDAFGYPNGNDRSGCDTRALVLREESLVDPLVLEPGCKVESGSWSSLYDARVFTEPALVEIDHVVALKEVWDSGAWDWPADRLLAYGNDVDDPMTLRAVSATSNQEKGDKDPTNWVPPPGAARCQFLSEWVAIKVRWSLTMDESEYGRIKNLLTDECGGGVIRAFVPLPVETLPDLVAAPEESDVYFGNCAEVRAVGMDPLYLGEPGYRLKLDRDKDGVACE